MSELKFSNRILRRFAETVALELGADQFRVMATLAKLPVEWTKPDTFNKMNALESAQAYAQLQAAMRSHFGRGARGVLLRVGARLWNHLLEDAALGGKAQAAVIKRLPLAARRKQTLELLAKFIGVASGDVTIHNLDLDLLLVDHTSPAADGQHSTAPICFITQGLIRESLYWATGASYDMEETACKAQGHHACEFKIVISK